MTTIKHLAFMFAMTFCSALLCMAQAQTPRVNTINITAESDKVHIAAQGEVAEMRLEVASEAGDIIFESGAITGQQLDWKMTDAQGERVAPGTYLVTVTFRTAAGKLGKRVKQVTVAEEEKSGTESTAPAPAPNAVQATITGTGTNGKIAKFTGASTIGNSIITESGGKIGINANAPGSKLTVIGGGSPLINAVNNVASSSGGDGVSGTGAPGADDFVGGDGGVGIVGKGGKGGNSDSSGYGGDGGAGIVGTGGAAGTGDTDDGSAGPGVLGIGGSPFGDGVEGNAVSSGGTGVYGHSHSGEGVIGFSISGDGLYAYSSSGKGVYGDTTSGYAGYFNGKVGITGNLGFGSTTRQMLNLYSTTYGIGVQTNTLYARTNVGFAWYKGGTHSNAQNNAGGGTVLMRLDSAGNVFANTFNPTSDRHMKANFSTVNSRLILTRLASIPIQTWNYKSEERAVRHIGPTAQDFSAAFGVGADDKHIATVDADGVTMAAIQGLYQMMQEKDRQIEQLQSQVVQLQRTVKRRVRRKR